MEESSDDSSLELIEANIITEKGDKIDKTDQRELTAIKESDNEQSNIHDSFSLATAQKFRFSNPDYFDEFGMRYKS